MPEKEKAYERFNVVVTRCAERDCAWNYVHWKDGERFPCGCCMNKVICDGRFKISIEDVKKKGMIKV